MVWTGLTPPNDNGLVFGHQSALRRGGSRFFASSSEHSIIDILYIIIIMKKIMFIFCMMWGVPPSRTQDVRIFGCPPDVAADLPGTYIHWGVRYNRYII